MQRNRKILKALHIQYICCGPVQIEDRLLSVVVISSIIPHTTISWNQSSHLICMKCNGASFEAQQSHRPIFPNCRVGDTSHLIQGFADRLAAQLKVVPGCRSLRPGRQLFLGVEDGPRRRRRSGTSVGLEHGTWSVTTGKQGSEEESDGRFSGVFQETLVVHPFQIVSDPRCRSYGTCPFTCLHCLGKKMFGEPHPVLAENPGQAEQTAATNRWFVSVFTFVWYGRLYSKKLPSRHSTHDRIYFVAISFVATVNKCRIRKGPLVSDL